MSRNMEKWLIKYYKLIKFYSSTTDLNSECQVVLASILPAMYIYLVYNMHYFNYLSEFTLILNNNYHNNFNTCSDNAYSLYVTHRITIK